MIRPKNETEELLISITKIWKKLIEQTHRNPEETVEFKRIKPRETFRFKPYIQTKGDWMVGLMDLEKCNSIFNITEENNKSELFTDNFDECSFEELKDELEEIFNNSDITPYHLQHEIIGPGIIQAYRKLGSEKSSCDGYFILLMGYARSPFRVFESYLRIVVGLDEDDIQLILKQYNANFVTYKLDLGLYTIEDLQDAVHPLGDHEETLQIEYDDLNKKTKLISTRFRSTFGTLRFDEKTFLNILLGFAPYWDYKSNNAIHADSPGVHTNDKILNLNTIKKILLKCDIIDGSVVNGMWEPIIFSFVLHEPST